MSAKLKKEESEFQARIDELNIKKGELETKIAVRTASSPPLAARMRTHVPIAPGCNSASASACITLTMLERHVLMRHDEKSHFHIYLIIIRRTAHHDAIG